MLPLEGGFNSLTITILGRRFERAWPTAASPLDDGVARLLRRAEDSSCCAAVCSRRPTGWMRHGHGGNQSSHGSRILAPGRPAGRPVGNWPRAGAEFRRTAAPGSRHRGRSVHDDALGTDPTPAVFVPFAQRPNTRAAASTVGGGAAGATNRPAGTRPFRMRCRRPPAVRVFLRYSPCRTFW